MGKNSFSFIFFMAFAVGAVFTVTALGNIASDFIGALELLIIGLAICSLSAWIFFRMKKKRDMEFVLKNGKRITAVVTDYRANYSVKVNGFHAIRLVCKSDHPDYARQVFYSSNYYVTSVLSHIGETATVYIDKNNPQHYRVEIPSLKEEGYGPDNVPKAVGLLFIFIGFVGTLLGGSIGIQNVIKGDPLWWIPMPIAGFFMMFGIAGLLIFLKAGNPSTERASLLYTGEKLRGEIIGVKEKKAFPSTEYIPLRS